MTEKKLVINHLKIEYSGLFDYNDLIRAIEKGIRARGYKKHEKLFEERVGSSGKDIAIELRPVKAKTAYFALMIKILMEFRNVTERTLVIDGLPYTFNQGEITMTFDAWTSTKYVQRWGTKPWFFFAKALVNKYVYKLPLEEGFIGEVASDTHTIYNEVKAHLNLYRYRIRDAAPLEQPAQQQKEGTGQESEHAP